MPFAVDASPSITVALIGILARTSPSCPEWIPPQVEAHYRFWKFSMQISTARGQAEISGSGTARQAHSPQCCVWTLRLAARPAKLGALGRLGRSSGGAPADARDSRQSPSAAKSTSASSCSFTRLGSCLCKSAWTSSAFRSYQGD